MCRNPTLLFKSNKRNENKNPMPVKMAAVQKSKQISNTADLLYATCNDFFLASTRSLITGKRNQILHYIEY